MTARPNVAELHEGAPNPVAELATPEAKELASNPVSGPSHAKTDPSFTSPSRLQTKASELPGSGGLKSFLRKPLSSKGLSDSASSEAASTPPLHNVIEPLKTSNSQTETFTAVELPTEIQSPTVVAGAKQESIPKASGDEVAAQVAPTQETKEAEEVVSTTKEAESSSLLVKNEDKSAPEVSQELNKDQTQAIDSNNQSEKQGEIKPEIQKDTPTPVVIIEDTSISEVPQTSDPPPVPPKIELDQADKPEDTKSTDPDASSSPSAVVEHATTPEESQASNSNPVVQTQEPKQENKPADAAPPNAQYLELLAKAAKGEISPQELAEILQKGGIS